MTVTEPRKQPNDFTSVPVLDYSLACSPETRPQFISQLRHVLINVGFFYLANNPIPPDLLASLADDYVPRIFAIPQEEKDKISMTKSQCFLGYLKTGKEITHGRYDWREQFDFASPPIKHWKEGENPKDHEYKRFLGESQWLEESVFPGFRALFEKCLEEIHNLSLAFSSLLAEALGLPSDALDKFYESEPNIRANVCRYPVVEDGQEDQGIGAHYDAGFLTFLLQASPHSGFQVQNLSGDWIDAPGIPGTLIVNIGKALEFVSRGVARATSHRVLCRRFVPGGDNSPRYSVPMFQYMRMDLTLSEHVLPIPSEILAEAKRRGQLAALEANNFSELTQHIPVGEAYLKRRLVCHPETGQRFYPELFKREHPAGLTGTNDKLELVTIGGDT